MHCTDFSIFSDKTIEHFMQPQNVGYMEDADAVGISGEPGCGDSLAIFTDDMATRFSKRAKQSRGELA